MMNAMPLRALMAFFIFVAVAGVTCQSDLIDDAGFQLWCGEELCVWEIEEGEIERVATWHEHDYGVSFVSDDVLLSQPAEYEDSSSCIATTSRIEPTVLVSVEIDQDGDGRIDWTQPIPPSDTFAYRVFEGPGPELDGVFYIRKVGEGSAVLARLRVTGRCSDYSR